MNFGSQDTKICFVRLKCLNCYFGYFTGGGLRLRGAKTLIKLCFLVIQSGVQPDFSNSQFRPLCYISGVGTMIWRFRGLQKHYWSERGPWINMAPGMFPLLFTLGLTFNQETYSAFCSVNTVTMYDLIFKGSSAKVFQN